MNASQDTPHKPVWSKELVLVVAIPLVTVVAGLVTLAIASQLGFTAHDRVQMNRFAQDASESRP